MKYIFLFGCILIFSCGKNKKTESSSFNQEQAVIQYDTMAVDSFSEGAISADVAQEIRVSTQKYQDSLAEIRNKMPVELNK
ncbi:hypothetical protein [Chryseobacterium sp.]|uniref:hypothetical protein n=1 Tax=Chryseobacterium sp. TaxID=1871047 RepID=UPI0011CCA940|nr:hypothetical protein [Chryseobacterium sp.]TXF75985.1 hypothetical protein FUA25_08770 [Chryseobacterium sp.]